MYSNEQKKLNNLQYRFTPYFLIALFTCVTAAMRLFLMPRWDWWIHASLFVLQLIAFTGVWHMIRWLNPRLEGVMPFAKGPVQRMLLQVFISLLVLAPIAATGLYIALPHLPPFVTKPFLIITIMLFVMIVFLFNFSFYAAWFFQNWQLSVEEKAKLEIEAERLEKEKSLLQYHQLRNQVNPHYLFNTLSSLDGLIQTDPQLASEFVQHMSKVYRYVLKHTENEVVDLGEELDFIQHYIELLHIRYGQGLQIETCIPSAAREMGIAMVTLQMLIDNAIKHNIVKPSAPLRIDISVADGYLLVTNNKQLRTQVETSNKQGLLQLSQLYGYLSPRPLLIDEQEEQYTIKIPLL